MFSLRGVLGREGSVGLGSGPGRALFFHVPAMLGRTLSAEKVCAGGSGFSEAYVKSSGLVLPLPPAITKCWRVQTHQAGRASFPGQADVWYQ